MLRITAPERAFLPSQSLRASSPKGRAIVLTASKVGCNKTCLKPSNSDLSARRRNEVSESRNEVSDFRNELSDFRNEVSDFRNGLSESR